NRVGDLDIRQRNIPWVADDDLVAEHRIHCATRRLGVAQTSIAALGLPTACRTRIVRNTRDKLVDLELAHTAHLKALAAARADWRAIGSEAARAQIDLCHNIGTCPERISGYRRRKR